MNAWAWVIKISMINLSICCVDFCVEVGAVLGVIVRMATSTRALVFWVEVVMPKEEKVSKYKQEVRRLNL